MVTVDACIKIYQKDRYISWIVKAADGKMTYRRFNRTGTAFTEEGIEELRETLQSIDSNKVLVQFFARPAKSADDDSVKGGDNKPAAEMIVKLGGVAPEESKSTPTGFGAGSNQMFMLLWQQNSMMQQQLADAHRAQMAASHEAAMYKLRTELEQKFNKGNGNEFFEKQLDRLFDLMTGKDEIAADVKKGLSDAPAGTAAAPVADKPADDAGDADNLKWALATFRTNDPKYIMRLKNLAAFAKANPEKYEQVASLFDIKQGGE